MPRSIAPVFEITDLEFPIRLDQPGPDRFSVTYGDQFNKNLTQAQAAHFLGESILHALQCQGRLDFDEAEGPQ